MIRSTLLTIAKEKLYPKALADVTAIFCPLAPDLTAEIPIGTHAISRSGFHFREMTSNEGHDRTGRCWSRCRTKAKIRTL